MYYVIVGTQYVRDTIRGWMLYDRPYIIRLDMLQDALDWCDTCGYVYKVVRA